MPSSGNLPDPGIEPMSPAAPALQVDSLLLSHQGNLSAEVQVDSWKEWQEQKFYRVRNGDFVLKVSEGFETENGLKQAF